MRWWRRCWSAWPRPDRAARQPRPHERTPRFPLPHAGPSRRTAPRCAPWHGHRQRPGIHRPSGAVRSAGPAPPRPARQHPRPGTTLAGAGEPAAFRHSGLSAGGCVRLDDVRLRWQQARAAGRIRALAGRRHVPHGRRAGHAGFRPPRTHRPHARAHAFARRGRADERIAASCARRPALRRRSCGSVHAHRRQAGAGFRRI